MTNPTPPPSEDRLRTALRERLDEALHEWWDDEHPGNRHACRPVPSEDEFLAIADRLGLTIALAAFPAKVSESELGAAFDGLNAFVIDHSYGDDRTALVDALDRIEAALRAAAEPREGLDGLDGLDDHAIERMARGHFEPRRHFFEPQPNAGMTCAECGEDIDQDFICVPMHFHDGDG